MLKPVKLFSELLQRDMVELAVQPNKYPRLNLRYYSKHAGYFFSNKFPFYSITLPTRHHTIRTCVA